MVVIDKVLRFSNVYILEKYPFLNTLWFALTTWDVLASGSEEYFTYKTHTYPLADWSNKIFRVPKSTTSFSCLIRKVLHVWIHSHGNQVPKSLMSLSCIVRKIFQVPNRMPDTKNVSRPHAHTWQRKTSRNFCYCLIQKSCVVFKKVGSGSAIWSEKYFMSQTLP